MGALDELQKSLSLQFISFFDSLSLLAECENSDRKTALVLLKRILKENVLYLRAKDLGLEQVACYESNYCEVDDDVDWYITKTAIIDELDSNRQSDLTTNHGFGLKSFLSVGAKLGVIFPQHLLMTAQSPDIYRDFDNPLTPIVQELQAELKALQSSDTVCELARLRAENAKLKKKVGDDLPTKAKNNYGKVIYALLVKNGVNVNNIEPHSYNANSLNSIIYNELQNLGIDDLQQQAIGNILSVAKSQMHF